MNDVIYGSSSYEDAAVSIEQLRAEAGHEGLRAKALMADIIRPALRGAGGPPSMVTRAQSVSSLIEEAGGLVELQALVAAAHMLRFRVNDVGGLHGIDNLISQAKQLQGKQQELADLKAQIDQPDGLRATAQKYSRLQQAFLAIETGVPSYNAQTSQSHTYTLANGSKTSTTSTDEDLSGLKGTAAMNPARARMLSSSKAPEQDPDRDLYEPKPFGIKPSISTKGSNHIPLGTPRGRGRLQNGVSEAPKKRHRDDEERETKVAKRPRIDVGRASALVQAAVCPRNAKTAQLISNADRITAPPSECPLDYGEERLEVSKREDPGFVQFMQQVTPVHLSASQIPLLADRASVETPLGPVQRHEQPTMKQEDLGDDQYTSQMLRNTSSINLATYGNTEVLVGCYPVAVWVGPSTLDCASPSDLVKPKDVPTELASFLAGEMEKYLTATHHETLKTMPANSDTCLLRYLNDGHRPSGQPQAYRACRTCTSAWVSNPRPCALLSVIDGTGMLVFLPLRDQLKRGVKWTEKRSWVMEP